MSQNILVCNSKGGVGKTTVAVNTADLLSEKGYKVLLVDTDAQGHCSISLGKSPLKFYNTIFELLTGEAKIKETIYSLYENLDLLPANLNLFDIEEVLTARKTVTPYFTLKKSLQTVADYYDYIIIDSPPNLGLMVYNSIIASDFVIVPVDSSFLGLEGYVRIKRTIEDTIAPDINRQVREMILLTMYDRRTKLSEKVREGIYKRYGKDRLFHSFINRNTDLQKATAKGVSIRKYAENKKKKPQGLTDFNFFISELLNVLTEENEAIG